MEYDHAWFPSEWLAAQGIALIQPGKQTGLHRSPNGKIWWAIAVDTLLQEKNPEGEHLHCTSLIDQRILQDAKDVGALIRSEVKLNITAARRSFRQETRAWRFRRWLRRITGGKP